MAVHRFVTTMFTPEDDVKSFLDAIPTRWQRSGWLEIYGLTDLQLVTNAIAASNRGVRVRVMNDRSQSEGPADRKALQMLADAGAVNGNILVKVVESAAGQIDHLKVAISDPEDGPLADTSAVALGSYNFSGSLDPDGKLRTGAQLQDNVFVYQNDPGVVAQAIAKFTGDWEHNPQDAAWQIAPTPPATPQAAPAPPSITVAVAGVPPEAVAATVAPATPEGAP